MRRHFRLGVMIFAAILLIAFAGAVFGPRFVREDEWPSNHNAGENRSDHKRWNNDASVHGFTN